MSHVVYNFKRGDDFNIPMTLTDPDNNGTPVDMTGWTVSAQARYGKNLIETFSCVITDAVQGQFAITAPAANTALWPVRELKVDIQFDRPVDGRVSSKTWYIQVEEDQTQ